jgi:hypothetical protein
MAETKIAVRFMIGFGENLFHLQARKSTHVHKFPSRILGGYIFLTVILVQENDEM